MTYIDEVVKILRASNKHLMAGDSKPLYQLTGDQIDELQYLASSEILARHTSRGTVLSSVSELEKSVQLDILPKAFALKMAGDSQIWNGEAGWGTLSDPQSYTRPVMPVMVGAGDSSALYASGGLPAEIVDKKSAAILTDGVTFVEPRAEKEIWTEDDIKQLEDSAQQTGFNDVASDAVRDSILYGGSILYPYLKYDTPSRLYGDVTKRRLEKGCISRWVEVDRWNTVFVPSFIPTAADYLKPKSIMVLQESVEVSTTRMCIIRPKPMPYWSVICNLGWSPSDITGWLRSYYAYVTTQMSIPVMAQQMSLLLYRMPLDALNATIGADQVDKLMAVNEQQMKNWSALSPKAVNMVGEVEVVDRSYSGFDQFVGAIKSDLAAQCEIPEPILWHTPTKGFTDNTQENLLKQADAMILRQRFIERYMDNAKDLLIAHTFGMDSEQWKQRDTLKMRFAKPEVASDKDLADMGAKFSASVNSLVQAGFTPDLAIKTSKQFYPKVVLTEEEIAEIKEAYEDRMAELQAGGQGAPSMAQSSITGQGMAKGGASNVGRNKPQKQRTDGSLAKARGK